jgi:glucan 1,3-beta-glucosidase
MLVEATKATWLVGTAFEHNTLYQYNLNNAQNVYIGMQQSEAPYWQGSGSASLAPAPWTAAGSDPTFSNCGSSDGQVSFSILIVLDMNCSCYNSAAWHGSK